MPELEPLDLSTATLAELTRWLVANDPNGCYTDEDRRDEGLVKMTTDEALGHYRRQSGSTHIHPVDVVRLLQAVEESGDSSYLVLDPETCLYTVQQFVESLPPSDSLSLADVLTILGRDSEWEMGTYFPVSADEVHRVCREYNRHRRAVAP